MEAPVEIRFAGVVIGRAQNVRSTDAESSFFLAVREPMPVGSVVHLRSGDRETSARVLHTVESSDPATCGMQVRLIGEAEEVATEWIPPPAPATEKARPAEEPVKTAMPVFEVQATFAQASAPAEPADPPKVSPQQTELAFPATAPAEPDLEQNREDQPASAAKTATVDAAAAEAVPEEVPVAPRTSTASYGTVSEAEPEASSETPRNEARADDAAPNGSIGTDEERSSSEDLPPARPIAGPSGRRKTKRRR